MIKTLLQQQRKLLVMGASGLALAGGFVFSTYRADSLAAYKVFADALVFLAGLFFAGNSSVYLWQHKYGAATPPKETKP